MAHENLKSKLNLMNKYIILTLFVLSISSCVTNRYGKFLNSSLGTSTENLRRQLGPPSFIVDNSTEGEVWVYSENFVRNQPGVVNRYGDLVLYAFPSQIQYTEYTEFFVKNNQVYRYNTNKRIKKPHWAFYVFVCPPCAIIELM